jgi:hypothetical protein
MREVATMRGWRRVVVVAAAVGAAVVAVPAAGWADTDPTGADFGEHVVQCAQTTGFEGEHNPGMHDGYAGWEAHEC